MTSILFITVRERGENLLSGARVFVRPSAGSEWLPLHFDEEQQVYRSEPIARGDYVVRAEAEGYASQEFVLPVTGPEHHTGISMGREGDPYYIIHGRRVYFEPDQKTFARQLRVSSEETAPEGPVIRVHAGAPIILTRSIEVVTQSGVTRAELEELIRPFGLHVTVQDTWSPNRFIVESDETPGPDFGAMPERLMALPEILSAQSILDTTNYVTAPVTPPDADFALQFHSYITRVPEAWGEIAGNYGSADIIVAVHDEGVLTDSTAPDHRHPDFLGLVAGGTLQNRPGLNKKKYLFAYDLRPTAGVDIRPGNDKIVSSHGTETAGVITAAVDGAGVAGTAANTRLCSFLWFLGVSDRITHTFDFMAGFQPAWKTGAAPYTLSVPTPFETGRNPIPGAHIINCSHTMLLLPPKLDEALQRLTLFGRDRRGTLVFAATGNKDVNCRNEGNWGENLNVMRVSASTLDLREEEVRANYSSYADKDDRIVDFCAPSESHNVYSTVVPTPPEHFPPLNFGFITSDERSDLGNLGGQFGARAVIQNLLEPGKKIVTVLQPKLASFSVGDNVVVRPVGDPLHSELHKIAAKAAPDSITLENPIGYRHEAKSAEIIVLSGAGYTDQFGGTSAATPQASAIAALMLTVNPALTWIEVRELMRRTAIPINLRYGGSPTAVFRYRWLDPNDVTLVDLDTLLRTGGRTSTDATPLIARTTRSVKLLNAAGVNARQALLLGAETKLTVAHAKDATVLTVANTDGFAKDDEIFLGRDSQTVLISAGNVGNLWIWVQSVQGFVPGDFLTIEPGGPNAEKVRINSVERMTSAPAAEKPNFNSSASDAETGLRLVAALTKAHPVRSVVEIADSDREGPHQVKDVIGSTLELVGKLGAPHPANRIVRKKNTEVRAVISVQGDQVEIDPPHFDHPASESVAIGLEAKYSLGFGYGRLDALAAVQAAKAYDHNERDLMIRNFIGDDGVNNVGAQEVESPDIWVRNDAPTAAAPIDADSPPHQRPEVTIDAAIHIGAGHNDLEVSGICTSAAELTFTVKIDATGATDTFEWSADGGVLTSGVAITGAVQDLSDGVKVKFGAVTGHALSDRWIIKARQVGNRFLHLRVKNRGTEDSFAESVYHPLTSPLILNVAQSRILLCVSDGFAVRRFHSVNPAPGTDDLDVVAKYTGNKPRALYSVEITHSDPMGDTFEWYRDGALKGTVKLSAATLKQTLDDGVEIQFGKRDGHKRGDRWDLYARSGPERFLNIDHYWEVPPGVANEFDPSTGRAGTQTLKTTAIAGLPGSKTLALNPLASNVVMHHLTWPEALRPPTNSPLRPPTRPLRLFVLGEVVPHDGKLAGFTAKDNNNFSFRELSFAKFRFTQANPLDPLEGQADISPLGAPQKPFRIEVRTPICTFATESVRLRFTASKDAAKSVHVYRYTGTSWKWDVDPAFVSVVLPRPARDKNGAQATEAKGEQFDIFFDCSYVLSSTVDTLQVDVEILSDLGTLVVASASHTMKVVAAAPQPTGTGEAVAATQPTPVSHVFADMNALTQTAEQAYGPVVDPPDADSATTRYRATSLFSATSDVNAYAVSDGFIAMQRDPTNDHAVNLILRPFHQPIAGFTRIRYFVYRGLKLDEFLKGKSGADAALMQVDALASPLVKEIRHGFLDLNPAVTDMPTTVLGYDPAQAAGDRLDDVFFRIGGSQLHYVTEGTILGHFDRDPARKFGFEIMVEEGDYAPTLDYARRSSYEVDTNNAPPNPFALRVKQEEILNFLDPAAFYGLHVENGTIHSPTGTVSDAFTDVVAKFATKHRLYVDIRSDNGSSLHFHRNYDVGGNQVQIGGTTGPLTAIPYEHKLWPILSVDASAAANTPNDFHELTLQLPRCDNEKPVLYVENGNIQPHCSFVRGSDLVTGTGSWTRTLTFRYPNTGAANAKQGIASVVRLHYGRLQVPTPTVVSPATVLKTKKYTDNVFGPIDRISPWASTAGIQWITTQDNRYVDADSELGWRQMMSSGIAQQTSGATPRVLLYAIATARDADAPTGFVPIRGFPDGVSDAATFFEECDLFGVYQLEIDEIDDNGTAVRTLQLRQNPQVGYPPSSAILLGLSKTEFATLQALSTAGLDKNYLRTVLLDDETSATDKNGRTYRRFRVGIQGLKTADGEYASELPAADIYVYTVDRHCFASKDFAAAEPLPTKYVRNYEEEKGAREWPVRERFIDAVDAATSTITLKSVDWREEAVPGGPLDVTQPGNQARYTISSVTLNGDDTQIVVSGGPALKTGASLGRVATVTKPVEDRFIDFDQDTAIPGSLMRALMKAFVDGLAPIANDQAALQAVVDAEAPKVLKRARQLATASPARADDYERCLYWARLSMGVALKDHPFCKTSLTARNALVQRLERHTRGYDVDFSGAAAGEHKVLLTGFDPYGLAADPGTSNPSAAVALALHGHLIPSSSGKTARIASAIFPVRYREFDADGIETFMNARLIDPANVLPGAAEMILTLSQNGSRPYYDLERFAGRLRGGDPDNEFVRYPWTKIGGAGYAEFYESNVPSQAMVPGPFTDASTQRLFFDQSFEDSKGSRKHPRDKGENTNKATPPAPTSDAFKGSGGFYLSNEIFYRTAHCRTKVLNTPTVTGHFHLPATAIIKTGIEDVIAEVEQLIKRWLNSLP